MGRRKCHHDICNHTTMRKSIYCAVHSIGLSDKEKLGKKILRKRIKKSIPKYKSIDDVRCPICKGTINSKWFNFRGDHNVEFVAECWSGNTNDVKPSHIFVFQIEVPPVFVVSVEDKK